jgi:hypothetical protein
MQGPWGVATLVCMGSATDQGFGGVTYWMESYEHKYFKNLVGQIGANLGYSVALERRFIAADSQNVIADIFLERGNTKFVIEIQRSPQTKAEFIRRQENYASIGIRAAWLYPEKNDQLIFDNDVPLFRYGKNAAFSNYVFPEFELTDKDFLDCLLSHQVK